MQVTNEGCCLHLTQAPSPPPLTLLARPLLSVKRASSCTRSWHLWSSGLQADRNSQIILFRNTSATPTARRITVDPTCPARPGRLSPTIRPTIRVRRLQFDGHPSAWSKRRRCLRCPKRSDGKEGRSSGYRVLYLEPDKPTVDHESRVR